MQTNPFLLLNKLKTTESAQVWGDGEFLFYFRLVSSSGSGWFRLNPAQICSGEFIQLPVNWAEELTHSILTANFFPIFWFIFAIFKT